MMNRLAMLTSYFGNNKVLLEKLGDRASAVYVSPIYQEVVDSHHSRGLVRLVHPSYYMPFGF